MCGCKRFLIYTFTGKRNCCTVCNIKEQTDKRLKATAWSHEQLRLESILSQGGKEVEKQNIVTNIVEKILKSGRIFRCQ